MLLQILCITNELSFILHRKVQNIIQVMSLVVVKTCLINLRSEGWGIFWRNQNICLENDIPIPNMEDVVLRFGRSRKSERNNIPQEHYFHVVLCCYKCYYHWVWSSLQWTSSELLVCFACLDPRDSFSMFDMDKLSRLADTYCDNFSFDDRKIRMDILCTFIIPVRRLEEFKVCYCNTPGVTMARAPLGTEDWEFYVVKA
jgi:hypothetical protein